MKITVLTENTSCNEQIGAEHGLSLYIEANGRKVLFDSGQTGLFAENAAALGADLAAIDTAVLSHGHYDHGGGMWRFIDINGSAPLYINALAFGAYYNGTEKYIGIDGALSHSSRVVHTEGECSLGDGLTLFCTDNEWEQIQPLDTGGLTEKTAEGFSPDDFLHEQYLLIEENGRRILVSGCSHRGVLNIMHHFRPDVFIGGFHFMKMETGSELLRHSAQSLMEYDCEYYTCHCTGVEQYEYLKTIMGERLHYISAGMSLDV